MLGLLKLFGELGWAIISSAFSLFKQLTGIRNDFWAAALGVSPFVASLIIFAFDRVKKYVH